jgi:succinate dehydrogenase / fumarate reductase iron-sulfur subunit
MPTFRLPKNSKVRPGKVYRAAKHNARVRRFHIYRYDPASSLPPSLDTYELDAGGVWADGSRCTHQNKERD